MKEGMVTREKKKDFKKTNGALQRVKTDFVKTTMSFIVVKVAWPNNRHSLVVDKSVTLNQCIIIMKSCMFVWTVGYTRCILRQIFLVICEK